MYNLETDLGERNDVSKSNSEIAEQMKTQLLEWLNSMNTHYAEEDKLWDEAAYKEKLDSYKNVLMPNQEKQRKNMLSPNWEPNKNWWGSQK